MVDQDEQRQAAEALATVREHQERTRRVTRLPWWVYAAIFVLGAAGSAANDFVTLSGAKLIAAVVLVAFVVVFATSFASGSAPLSKVRGVQPRQSFVPSAFGVVVVVGGLAVWLISHYGTGWTNAVAGSVGLRDYPNTVAGVLFGAAFTALFALSQLLIRASQRRTTR
jgi:precorrin isomerase